MTAERALATLEFPAVRALLAERTAFAPGRELALALVPTATLADAERLQDETAAARALVSAKPATGLAGAHDIRDALRRATLGGTLDPEQLVAVGRTVRAAERLYADVHPYPPLAARCRFAPPPLAIAVALEHAIGTDATVLDRASPALGGLRSALRGAQVRLQQRVDNILRSGEVARFLQDPIVTQRGGRYVVPVKAEHRGAVKGIVHDQSASGQTVFIEPLEILEANNTLREAELAERAEVARVLDELSRRVEAAGDELRRVLDALAALDLILAKAALAEAEDATRPRLNGDGIVDLRGARHPLLVAKGAVVPVDVRLGSDFRVLVVTGPNTGGKTVTLKTIGLLTLMAGAGLQVPASRDSSVPVVPRVYADIGDEQSIAQSLSTFSSHLRNVVATLADARAGDLALLDELGAGTDPDEGAALAQAVLEQLMAKHALAVVTTHYTALKAWAAGGPAPGETGADRLSAGMGYDADALVPTYRLALGRPGASLGLDVAARLGLPASVLDRAKHLVAPQTAALERAIAALEAERQTVASTHARLSALERAAREAALRQDAAAAAIERERDDFAA
ncbi:MAG: endonuclease MutS2, partial [Candidatus Limnocylindria bacterium]|nr:endonuclease MutS2 [Candidatus Limnocylindria bacterium]